MQPNSETANLFL